MNDPSVRFRFRIALLGCAHTPKQLIPISLWPATRSAPFAANISNFWNRLHAIDFEDPDLVLVDQPCFFDRSLARTPWRIVYRPTDVYGPMASDSNYLEKCEAGILRVSRGVVATSQSVLTHLRKRYSTPSKSIILENGVDLDQFTTKYPRPSEYNGLDKSRIIVYVGATDARFAMDDIDHAASQLPECQFFIVGPRSEGASTSHQKNVHFLGSRPYTTIPAYLQHAGCGILPLSAHPSNSARSPMKFYEYLASRVPVICSWTETLESRRVQGKYLYRDRAELCALLRLARDGQLRPGNPSELTAVTWENQARALLSFASSL